MSWRPLFLFPIPNKRRLKQKWNQKCKRGNLHEGREAPLRRCLPPLRFCFAFVFINLEFEFWHGVESWRTKQRPKLQTAEKSGGELRFGWKSDGIDRSDGNYHFEKVFGQFWWTKLVRKLAKASRKLRGNFRDKSGKRQTKGPKSDVELSTCCSSQLTDFRS